MDEMVSLDVVKRFMADFLEAVESDGYVKVVRCKDCEWYKTEHGFSGIELKVCGLSTYNHPLRGEDDYCSKAKRRE